MAISFSAVSSVACAASNLPCSASHRATCVSNCARYSASCAKVAEDYQNVCNLTAERKAGKPPRSCHWFCHRAVAAAIRALDVSALGEGTAVPELRFHAARLAATLLGTIPAPATPARPEAPPWPALAFDPRL